MGRLIAPLAATAALWLLAAPAMAGISFGDWTMRGAVLPDGAPACVAEVAAKGAKLSLWAAPLAPWALQVYAPGRRFDPAMGSLIFRIVPVGAWRFRGASVMGPSIVVPIPRGEKGRAFLDALSRGQEAQLLTATGAPLGAWSLAGSARAIDALRACEEGLRDGQND